MPDLNEQLVRREDTRAELSRRLWPAISLVIGAVLAIGFITLGLSAINIQQIFPPNRTSQVERKEVRRGVEPKAPVPANQFPEGIERLLIRLCDQDGPDYVSECRLLSERLCNQPALERAMRKLEERRNHPASAMLGTAFIDHCDHDPTIGFLATVDYFRMTDFEKSLNTIDRFPRH